MKPILALMILCSSAAMALANILKWENTVIEVAAQKGQKEIVAEFPFVNESAGAVEILTIQTSCNCTVANLPQNAFKGGEKGSLTVIFKPEERRGPQKKTIVVRYKGIAKPEILTFKTNIPETISVIPTSLSWKVSETTTPKYFEITTSEPSAKVVSVRVVGDSFSAVLEKSGNSTPYRVAVTPQSANLPIRRKICIEVEDPKKRFLYLIVEVLE